jgi:Zinc knuckle
VVPPSPTPCKFRVSNIETADVLPIPPLLTIPLVDSQFLIRQLQAALSQLPASTPQQQPQGHRRPHPSPPSTPPARRMNAIEKKQLDALAAQYGHSAAKAQELWLNRLCFKCEQTGHRAATCTADGPPKGPSQ